MAEQYLKIYKLDKEHLFQIIENNDQSLRSKIDSNEELRDEIDELIQEIVADEDTGPYNLQIALEELLSAKLDKNRTQEYMLVLDLLLEIEGEKLGEIVLLGNDWNEMGTTFTKWNLPNMTKLWEDSPFTFPWREEESPKDTFSAITSMLLEKDIILQLNKELKEFEISAVNESLDDDANETIEYLIENMLDWTTTSDTDLILMLE